LSVRGSRSSERGDGCTAFSTSRTRLSWSAFTLSAADSARLARARRGRGQLQRRRTAFWYDQLWVGA